MAYMKQIESSKEKGLQERLNALEEKERLQESEKRNPANPLTERDKQKLATMTAKELMALINRCNADYVRAALMTEEERAEVALDKLTAALLATDGDTEIKDLVALCREVLDRIRGKPGQTIMQTNVNVDAVALRKEFSAMSLETLDAIERLMIEGVTN